MASGNLNSCARATGAGTPKVGGFRTAPEKEAGVARPWLPTRDMPPAGLGHTGRTQAEVSRPQSADNTYRTEGAPREGQFWQEGTGGGPERAIPGLDRDATGRRRSRPPARPRSHSLRDPSRRTRHGPRCALGRFSDLSPARATSLAGWCREGLAHARRAHKPTLPEETKPPSGTAFSPRRPWAGRAPSGAPPHPRDSPPTIGSIGRRSPRVCALPPRAAPPSTDPDAHAPPFPLSILLAVHGRLEPLTAAWPPAVAAPRWAQLAGPIR